MTLTNKYQYIGRSNGVKASGRDYYFYILLYAKTTGSETTGKHTVSVKMRLACTASSTFYGWLTDGNVTVDGKQALGWTSATNPGEAWSGYDLTAGGVYYPRYTDLGEGTVEVDTKYAAKTIRITANWQRLAISGETKLRAIVPTPDWGGGSTDPEEEETASTVPDWLPSITEAKYSADIVLPKIKKPEEDPEPEPEPEPEPPSTPSPVVVYADGQLVYDSLLEEYDLAGLKSTHGLNVAGTAEIIMQRAHPAYNAFIPYRTIVDIYRDGKRRFRGRALYTAENFYGQRTVTCEGELCFLRDSINRPYKYEATPRSCFVTILNAHNAAVEPEKQFKVGDVTVTDAEAYIKLESDKAETTLDTLNKLVERCGGYVVFTDAEDGSRTINWLAELDHLSSQSVEFGENLLDFASTGASTTDLATALVPYGARDTETKKRVTIKSVNGGKDWIQDETAVALRGTIMAAVTWDDVTEPADLLKKAKAWLKEHKVLITSLELNALDLSYLDKSIDSFTVGDTVRVVSIPHGIDEDFLLSQMTEDYLHPEKSKVTLGKTLQSLTGAGVAGEHRNAQETSSTATQIQTDYLKEVTRLEKSIQDTNDTVATKVGDEASTRSTADANLQTQITDEVNARAGIINKVAGTVHISGGAPVKILGGRVDIDGSGIYLGREARFKNESGIRIATANGSEFYVLRVDASDNCYVGNDYTELYLRAKTAVYLHKTGATVTSDAREKDHIEPLSDAYMTMLDKLEPVRFTYKGRDPEKYHVGFTAQDVAAAMESAGLQPGDFGGFVDLNGDGSMLGLAYDEFIGLLLHKIRKLEKRIDEMEDKK